MSYIDKLQEQRHRQYAAELRDAGWLVVHESDFTRESFHTDPYFRAVVERVVRWYENPVDPPSEDELRRMLELINNPDVLGPVDGGFMLGPDVAGKDT